MPKVRALAPLTDKDGEPIAQGAVVDVDDETATVWRGAGKVSLIEDEERNAKAATHYGDVVGRDKTAGLGGGGPSGGPQEDDDDESKGKKGKK